MRGFTRRSAIALALVAALGVAACGGDDDSSGGGGGAGVEVDKMVWAIQSPVQSMDPAIMADVPTLRAQTAAFDRVLSIDNNGVVQPWIASKFDTSDPLKLVLTIRDDVKFWDGTAMTVDDVVYSIARHVGPDSTSMQSFNFAAVTSVEATDASTVTITLAAPDPGLPAKLSVRRGRR
jgi:peptide/nickel transport system substrate-binding protein